VAAAEAAARQSSRQLGQNAELPHR
jgi:hypothetical protein